MEQELDLEIPEWTERKVASAADWRAAFRAIRGTDRIAFFEIYDVYLKSSHWITKRMMIMECAGYMCEMCHQAKATEVHHLTYKNVGDELPEDLVAICHNCHETHHTMKRERYPSAAELVADAVRRLELRAAAYRAQENR